MYCLVRSTRRLLPRPPRPLPFLVRQRGPLGPRRLRITDLERGDTATVLEIFNGMSETSRFRRFHTGQPAMAPRMMRRLADIDPGCHVAHIALLDGRPVGLVRWIRFPGQPDVADLALEVIDDAHGRGVGRALVRRAAASASAAGITDFLAYIAVGNRSVRDWATARGAVTDPEDDAAMRLPVTALIPHRRGRVRALPRQRRG